MVIIATNAITASIRFYCGGGEQSVMRAFFEAFVRHRVVVMYFELFAAARRQQRL